MSERSAGAGAQRIDGRDIRWNDHRAERHERVLRTALTAIERDGADVGVASIADEAGIPRSVVYRLFRNREDLDEHIRARIIDDLMVALTPALDPKGTVRDAIRCATETYVGWVAEHPRLHQFLGTGSATRRRTGSRVVTGTRTAIALHLWELLDQHLAALVPAGPVPPGTSENVAFGMIGLVDGAGNRWVSHPESRSSAEELTSFLSDALWGVLTGAAARLGLDIDPELRVGPA